MSNNNKKSIGKKLNFSKSEGLHMENAKKYILDNPKFKASLKNVITTTQIASCITVLNRVCNHRPGFKMHEIFQLQEWVTKAEANVPTSAKKIEIEVAPAQKSCSIEINNIKTFMNMGYKVAALGLPVNRNVVSESMIEAAVSCLKENEGKIEVALDTRKFTPQLAIMPAPLLELVSILNDAEVETIASAKVSLSENCVIDASGCMKVASCAPVYATPVIVQDKRNRLFLQPKAVEIPKISAKTADSFFGCIHGMAKKHPYTAISDGHILGHSFGNVKVYMDFLIDFKTFNIGSEETVVIHSADTQYAYTLKNYDDTLKVVLIGKSTARCGRYRTVLAHNINKVKGYHIIVDPISIATKEKTTLFDVGPDNDSEHRMLCKEIDGVVIRRVSVFAMRGDAAYLSSISMSKLSAWELILNPSELVTYNEYMNPDLSHQIVDGETNGDGEGDQQTAAEGDGDSVNGTSDGENSNNNNNNNAVPTVLVEEKAPKATVDVKEKENDDDEGVSVNQYSMADIKAKMIIYAAHWYVYPWTRCPLIYLRPDLVPSLDGVYDLKIKREDVHGMILSISDDIKMKEFLDTIVDYDEDVREEMIKDVKSIQSKRVAVSNNKQKVIPQASNNATVVSRSGAVAINFESDDSDGGEEDEIEFEEQNSDEDEVAVVSIKGKNNNVSNAQTNNSKRGNGVAPIGLNFGAKGKNNVRKG